MALFHRMGVSQNMNMNVRNTSNTYKFEFISIALIMHFDCIIIFYINIVKSFLAIRSKTLVYCFH